MIIVDSREKKWEHIKTYFDDHNIDYVFPQKLDVGDYLNLEHPEVVIDRKHSLQEIASNLGAGEENIKRFTRECKRAKEQGIRFVVLIEGTNCTCMKDVSSWKSKYTKQNGKWLIDRMFELTVAYGVEWKFCRSNQTASIILKELGYE